MKAMRTIVLAAALLLTSQAWADTGEDYAACLIGYSVVALEKQGAHKDALAAFAVARSRCPEPDGLDPDDESREGTFYTVENIAEGMVERMAAE